MRARRRLLLEARIVNDLLVVDAQLGHRHLKRHLKGSSATFSAACSARDFSSSALGFFVSSSSAATAALRQFTFSMREEARVHEAIAREVAPVSRVVA